MPIRSEIQSLAPSALIELFMLDLGRPPAPVDQKLRIILRVMRSRMKIVRGMVSLHDRRSGTISVERVYNLPAWTSRGIRVAPEPLDANSGIVVRQCR